MWDATYHLCGHILPDTAMRQWVLTAPYEVRRVMALRLDALTACHRLFVKEIARRQTASSSLAGAETGSVTDVAFKNATLITEHARKGIASTVSPHKDHQKQTATRYEIGLAAERGRSTKRFDAL